MFGKGKSLSAHSRHAQAGKLLLVITQACTASGDKLLYDILLVVDDIDATLQATERLCVETYSLAVALVILLQICKITDFIFNEQISNMDNVWTKQ